MPIEIERRFLVRGDFVADAEPGVYVIQGYLPPRGGWSRRVRIIGGRAVFTLKSPKIGCSRTEIERAIPLSVARSWLATRRIGGLVEKTRHIVHHRGFMWEVDVFHGLNAGLVIAEIELNSPATLFPLPHWVGREVTNDHRYGNSALALRPFAALRHAA